jgi:hypothetical protein
MNGEGAQYSFTVLQFTVYGLRWKKKVVGWKILVFNAERQKNARTA